MHNATNLDVIGENDPLCGSERGKDLGNLSHVRHSLDLGGQRVPRVVEFFCNNLPGPRMG